MKNTILFLMTLTFSGIIFADCENYPLKGEWLVFYHGTQTGDIAIDSKITINKSLFGNYRVELEDPVWKVSDKRWKFSCISGKRAELKGFFNERASSSLRQIPAKITRIININELETRPSGGTKLNQIEIDIPVWPVDNQTPGHAHGDQ